MQESRAADPCAGAPSAGASGLPHPGSGARQPEASPVPARLPAGAVAGLSLAALGSGMSMRVNDALLPHLAHELGQPLGSVAQVTSLFAVAYGLAQCFFGPVGDRFGKYRVVGWAALACALTALACAAAPGFDALRAARVAAGATAAAIIPLSMAWIGDVVPYAQRQPVLARFLVGQIMGLSLGVWLGGVAADRGSWRAPYGLIALLFALTGIALLRLERRLPAQARATRHGAGFGFAHMAAEYAAVLARPWARAVLAIVFLEGVCLYGPFAFVASRLHQAFALSLSASGAVVMLFGLGGLGFALLSRVFLAGLGEAGLAGWGGAGMSLALLAIAFAPDWGYALGGCLLLGLGFYMMHNTLQVHATQMAPERRGAAVSAFAGCFFLGQACGVALGGQVVGRAGIATLLVAGAAGLAVLAATLAAALATRRARPVAV